MVIVAADVGGRTIGGRTFMEDDANIVCDVIGGGPTMEPALMQSSNDHQDQEAEA